MPPRTRTPKKESSSRTEPIVILRKMNPVVRLMGLASGLFLTICVIVMMLGKLTDITGLSEGWRYTFVTLSIVAGALNLVAWSIVDSTEG